MSEAPIGKLMETMENIRELSHVDTMASVIWWRRRMVKLFIRFKVGLDLQREEVNSRTFGR